MVSVFQLQVAQLAQYSASSRCPPVSTGLHWSPPIPTNALPTGTFLEHVILFVSFLYPFKKGE